MTDGPIDRQHQHVQQADVVRRRGIRPIDADRIRRADERLTGPPEYPVWSRVVDVPRKLLGDDVNLDRLHAGRRRQRCAPTRPEAPGWRE